MPNLGADEIITQKHSRAFIQFGGARPTNAVKYGGQDAQYIAVTGVTNPDGGAITPIYVSDPRRQGFYRLIGRTRAPAALAGSTLMFMEKHGFLPAQLRKNNCALTVYNPMGTCKDLSDFISGWTDYVLIYSGGLVDNKQLGDRAPFAGDAAIEDSLTVTWADVYPVGPLAFGNQAAVQVVREAVDVVYGSSAQCGDCGPFDTGTNRIYCVTKSSGAGSPGLLPYLVYSTDGGANWTQIPITSIGNTEDPLAMDIVGDKLVIVGVDAYYWATINSLTGVPGTFTKVTSGFVATKSPQDIFVLNPREVFFVGSGGYIYKSTDVTSGVTVIDAASAASVNYTRITGSQDGSVLVAVGATSTVVKSVNRGATWTTTTTFPAAAATLQAAAVLDRLRFWVGSAGGKMFYTVNGGETWTEKTFTLSGTGSITDIVFVNDEVGYMAHTSTTPTGYLWTTWNGGVDWTRSDSGTPRIQGYPVNNRINRMAVPTVNDNFVAANNVALAGLAGDALDGVLYLGIAGVL